MPPCICSSPRWTEVPPAPAPFSLSPEHLKRLGEQAGIHNLHLDPSTPGLRGKGGFLNLGDVEVGIEADAGALVVAVKAVHVPVLGALKKGLWAGKVGSALAPKLLTLPAWLSASLLPDGTGARLRVEGVGFSRCVVGEESVTVEVA